ncbi:MAG: hypothetical protein IPJ02_02055 [Chitinophagaceae bacterium]|nr:hypothetical protein [Chitinophagaceae bacterium]
MKPEDFKLNVPQMHRTDLPIVSIAEQQLAEIIAIRAMIHAYILTTLDEEKLKIFEKFVNSVKLTTVENS